MRFPDWCGRRTEQPRTGRNRGRSSLVFAIAFLTLLSRLGAPAGALDPASRAALARAAAEPGSFALETWVVSALAASPGEAREILTAARQAAPDRYSAIAGTIATRFPGFADLAREADKETPEADAQPLDAAAADAAAAAAPSPPARRWSGEVELGGSITTGNTERETFDASADATYKKGRWTEKVTGEFNFSRDDGDTNQRRIIVNSDARYRFNHRLFVSLFVEFEDDDFAGIEYRFTENPGLGYLVLEGPRVTWDIAAGPGLRQTKFTENGGAETEFVGRLTSAFKWNITDSSTLSNKSAFIGGTDRVTADSETQLTVPVVDSLFARLSFRVRFNSNVPEDKVKTDTLTRASFVYSF